MFALNAQRRQGQGDFTEEVAWRMGDSYRKKGEEGRIACLSPFFLSASNRGRSRPAVALSLGARSRPSLPPPRWHHLGDLPPPAPCRNEKFPSQHSVSLFSPFPFRSQKEKGDGGGAGAGVGGGWAGGGSKRVSCKAGADCRPEG